MNLSKQEIRDFAAEVNQAVDGRLDKAILFGSYAREEQLPGSDVDILLVMKEHKEGDQSKVSKIGGEYFLNKDVFISPKIIEKSELEEKSNYSFFKEIMQEGVKIHG